MTLFQIGESFAHLHALLAESGGEIAPEAEAHVTAWMEQLATDEAAKLDGYVMYLRQLDTEAEAARKFAAEYAAKARVRENLAKALKDRVKAYLEQQGRKDAVTATGVTIAVQKAGGKAPLLIDDVDPATLPDRLCKVLRQVDREAVQAALDGGEALAFARVGERGTFLKIKV